MYCKPWPTYQICFTVSHETIHKYPSIFTIFQWLGKKIRITTICDSTCKCQGSQRKLSRSTRVPVHVCTTFGCFHTTMTGVIISIIRIKHLVLFFFLKVTLLTGVCEWHLLEPCRLQRAWLQAVLIATFFKWSIKEAKSLAPTLRQKLSQWFVENNFNADSCPWSALFSDDHIVLHYLGSVPPNTTSSL